MEAVAVRVTQTVGRLGGLAAGMTAVLVMAACGNGSAGSAGPTGGQPSAGSEHAGHHPTGVPVAAALRPGERFVTLAMPQPYTPSAPHGGTDEYRCFLVDPKLTSTAYLTGSQFMPQNTAIVHHAIFFRVDPADAAKARSVDAASPGEGWTCFGDAGIGGGAGRGAPRAPRANHTLLFQGAGFPRPPRRPLLLHVDAQPPVTHRP